MAPRILGLFVIAVTGCSFGKRSDSEGSTAPGEVTNVTTIRTMDSEFIGGSGLALYAPPADVVRYQLVVDGRSSAGEVWSAVTQPDGEMVRSGHGTARIEERPASVGIAEVHRVTSTGTFVRAVAGTLEFDFTRGHIAGKVIGATPDGLNGTFEGVLGVVCYVQGTGVYEGGSVMSDDGGPAPVLALDEKLESPACEPLRPWKPEAG